jgi:ketosteroid isomerase-like protein
MSLHIRFVALLLITANCCLAQNASDTIRQIMKNQETCWNQGDLECFMIGYWESDSLMFISKDQVYYGYQSTLERYQKTYPDVSAMGQLTFEFISMRPLSATYFHVVGKYHLKRDMDDLEGHFTLLWRKINGEWVIIADHSS